MSRHCECSLINFLTEHIVHKLSAIGTRFFVSYIKIPVLVKTSALKKIYLVPAKNYKSITFASNNQFKVSGCFQIQAILYLSP